MIAARQLQADKEEERSIRIYELWQGWAQESALADIEQRLRSEVRTRGKSWPRFGRVALGLGLGLVMAIAGSSLWGAQ